MLKDFCTWSPDSIFGYDISNACEKHDIEYRKYDKIMTRKEADANLRENIKAALPTYLHFIAWIYYIFVRLFSKAGWERWNYNWWGILAWKKK